MNLRLLALAGVAACAVALPLAVASAGPVGDEGRPPVRASGQADARDSVRASGRVDGRDSVRPSARVDAKAFSAEPGLPGARPTSREGTPAPFLLGLGLATAARCGPELTSPDGVEAQTCVMTQGEENWARTYYRNATGGALDTVLSLLGPGGRAVQIRCAIPAEDEPGTCETPRERTQGHLDGYTAVTEFAAKSGDGRLLLRSGSNSRTSTGS
ncbi:hypothetical protein [Streptomyces sp. LBL]|uniref:hypothetical protein n=1 Tax=Streptomyces sp. LBL TaxID=2940562 RepID=UPI0024762C4D|nr:hypothetical protein [Streptomyces sp. LBL]